MADEAILRDPSRDGVAQCRERDRADNENQRRNVRWMKGFPSDHRDA